MQNKVKLDHSHLYSEIRLNNFYTCLGKIDQIVGMTVEATGITCNIGDVCTITMDSSDKTVISEVVGFKEGKVLLMPYEDVDGIGYGSIVRNTGEKLMIKMSNELIGRTVNALGEPIDGKGEINGYEYYSINGVANNPMSRPPISEPIELGVKAIDGMLTMGKGQRMGIFAGSGVGKSTLMGMIARNIKADVNVIALVGERGREVLEFINRDLGEEGAARSVVVVATSDQPAMLRSKCALTATTIAEYFRDQGKDVLLMMDSLTRYCMAQREIGLSVGEPPVVRGYTPSIYATLPKLLERSGNFEKGSITGIYTVLVEGDDSNEPISDTVRGIIDGHIMLSRKVAMRNHYPAIDVLGSISRLMSQIIDPEHKKATNEIRKIMSIYQENQDLISIGAYKAGSNPDLDYAISKIDRINAFLQQPVDQGYNFNDTISLLKEIVND
jgi:flagellum-specific ATP synthase